MSARGTEKAAVFLDRDGVLVVPEFRDGRSFAPRRVRDLCLFKDIRHPLSLLKSRGFLLVVVTNQPDLGHGLIEQETLAEMHKTLMDELPIDLIKTCPHRQQEGCFCRKPKPGLILEAAQELGIRLDASFLVGDRASDIGAGHAAGCRTVFIDLEYAEPKPAGFTYAAKDLAGATDFILRAGDPREGAI